MIEPLLAVPHVDVFAENFLSAPLDVQSQGGDFQNDTIP
jgi:hypothetical protein